MVNYSKGYDLSIVQGVVDFNSIKAAGRDFIINRCYVGNNGLDIYYNKNIANAQAAGLYVGCYNFPFPLPYTSDKTRSPQWQAETHFKAAGNAQNLLHTVDIEFPVQADWKKWNVDANFINDWLFTYLEIYQGLLGKPPVIYSYPNYIQTLGNPAQYGNYPLWIASYQANAPYIPLPWKNKGFVLWQNSGGTEKLPNGVPVDGDFCPDLNALWGTTPTVAVNPPNSIPDISTIPPAPPPQSPPVVAPAPPPAPAIPTSVSLPTINVSSIPAIVKNIYNWFKKN
jgi:GH25 family lysozyme M1 (1,4-beta-N-acetylmuramidase)